MSHSKSANFAFFLALVLSFSGAFASDGRIELNQTSIEANGGFPYTIADPGSYVLTGPLTVPAGTDGLVLASVDISIDLNGFSIHSSFVCVMDACLPGSGDGIKRAPEVPAHGSRATVKNGAVIGFASYCLRLGDYAHVNDLKVLNCGRSGIGVGQRSTVVRNTVSNTGNESLLAGSESVYAHNVLSLSGLDNGAPTVSGGQATAGNSCDDGNCGWVDTRRRFYVSPVGVMGDSTLTACDDGFHMASIWEMLDVTRLRYDTSRGHLTSDMGSGPPNVLAAWVRTGRGDGNQDFAGRANCDSWTSANPLHYGSFAVLQSYWNPLQGGPPADSRLPGWQGGSASCDTNARVWCIED